MENSGFIDFASAIKNAPEEEAQNVSGYMDFAQELRATGTPEVRETKEAAARIREAFTGEARQTKETRTLPRASQLSEEQGLGRLKPSSLKKDAQMAVAFMTSSTPEEFSKAWQRIYPGSTTETDDKGNLIVVMPDGRKGVVNKPGFDFTDILRIGSEVSKFAPAGKASAMASGIKKIPAAMGLAGITATMNEALSEDFEISQVAMESALGGAGEAVPLLFKSAAPRIKAAFNGLKSSSDEAIGAVSEFIEKNAEEIMETAAPRMREAAEKSVTTRLEKIRQEAKPLYDAANKANPPVDLTPVRLQVREIAKEYGPSTDIYKSVSKAFKIIAEADTFQKLNGAKKQLDKMIRAPQIGEFGLAAEERAQILKIRNSLLGAMDEASPDYKKARAIYSEELPEVQQIKDSLVGRISKMMERDYSKMTDALFRKQEIPSNIKKARALVEDQIPGAMDDMVSLEMLNRLYKASEITDGEITTTIPQLYSKLFGDKAKVRTLLAASGEDQARALKQLESIMRVSAERSKDAAKPIVGGDFIQTLLISPFRILQRTVDANSAKVANRQLIALSQALTNPEVLASGDAKRFLSMKINSYKAANEAAKALMQLTDEVMDAIPEEVVLVESERDGYSLGISNSQAAPDAGLQNPAPQGE